MLNVGAQAPDFTLKDQDGRAVTLRARLDAADVLLVFFPLAFTGICQRELEDVQSVMADVQAIAVSVGPPPTHKVWATKSGFTFPLLSDFWPHGAVATAYDVFDERQGRPRRSSYVVDKQGLIRWSVHHATPQGRDLEEHLRQLRAAAEDAPA